MSCGWNTSFLYWCWFLEPKPIYRFHEQRMKSQLIPSIKFSLVNWFSFYIILVIANYSRTIVEQWKIFILVNYHQLTKVFRIKMHQNNDNRQNINQEHMEIIEKVYKWSWIYKWPKRKCYEIKMHLSNSKTSHKFKTCLDLQTSKSRNLKADQMSITQINSTVNRTPISKKC